MLQLVDVHKRFGAVVVAEAVDLTVLPGEIHALIGPNGAGKTSLIGQVAGEIVPDRGSILLNGEDVTRWPPPRRARAGLVRSFQVTSLFDEMTALENVILAVQPTGGHGFGLLRPALRRHGLRRAAEAVLGEVGLLERADQDVSGFAHGEKRQLEIALALAGRPRLMLLDEPLAGQAAAEGAATVVLLERLRGRHGVLLVEHDMDAVFRLADRISVMVEGRIVATGPPAAIRDDPAVRSAYLGDA